MSFFSSVKDIFTGKALTSKLKPGEKLYATALPLGPGGIGGAAASVTTSIKNIAVATFAATGLTAFIAGGGLKLIPRIFSAEKKAVKRVVKATGNEKLPPNLPMSYATQEDLGAGLSYSDLFETAGLTLGAGAIGYGIGQAVDYFKSNTTEPPSTPAPPQLPPAPAPVTLPTLPPAPVASPPAPTPLQPLPATQEVLTAPTSALPEIMQPQPPKPKKKKRKAKKKPKKRKAKKRKKSKKKKKLRKGRKRKK